MTPDLKLNPCPFCGGVAELQHGQSGKDYITYYAVVVCTNCRASTRRATYPATEPVSAQAEQKAVNLWNRRWKRA